MSLNMFYHKVISNLGLYVDESGFIYNSNKENKVPITTDGKPLVLPTNENLNSVFSKNDHGELEITKAIFNPMNEDVIKGDSPSLKKMKTLAERRLGHLVAIAGELLLLLASNKDLQKKTTIGINKFLKRVNEANGQGIKQIVDDKTIDAWSKIYSKSLTKPQGFFSIYLKKAGNIEGIKFTRLATLSSPAYDELLELEADGKVFDVTLRKKDVTMFKIIFQYLIPEFESTDVVSIGSNDIEHPAFISLMQIYLSVVKKTNKVFKDLSFVNQQLADECMIEDIITEEDLSSLKIYLPELKNIPNEHDLNRNILKTEKQQINMSKLNQPIAPQPMMSQNPIFQSNMIPETPVAFGGGSSGVDPLLKGLGRARQAYQPQGVMYTQPNHIATPMGVNSIQPPMNMNMYNPIPIPQSTMNTMNYGGPVYTTPMGVNGYYR